MAAPAFAGAPTKRTAPGDATARYLEARQVLPTVALPDPSTLTEEERRALRGMVIYDRVEPPTAEEIAAAAASPAVSEDPVKEGSTPGAKHAPSTWEELAKRRGAAGGAAKRR